MSGCVKAGRSRAGSSALLVVAVSTLILTGCSGPSSSRNTSPRAPSKSSTVSATFPKAGLSFRHPRQWPSYQYQEPPQTFSNLITYLSTEPLHSPCTTTKHPSGKTVSCGLPLARLTPGAVLLAWTLESRPGLTLATVPGTPTSIDGHQAHAASGAAAGKCAQIAGTWQDEVVIAEGSGPASGMVRMSACVAAPGVSRATRQVQAMLTTVRLHG